MGNSKAKPSEEIGRVYCSPERDQLLDSYYPKHVAYKKSIAKKWYRNPVIWELNGLYDCAYYHAAMESDNFATLNKQFELGCDEDVVKRYNDFSASYTSRQVERGNSKPSTTVLGRL